MIDCILINSPDDLYSGDVYFDPKLPLGLLYIASYLIQKNFSVYIIDCHNNISNIKEIIKIVKQLKPKIVGINNMTPNREASFQIAQNLKAHTNTKVILGGPHASCYPNDVFKNVPSIDGVVLGEGEKVLLRILKSFPEIHSLPGFLTKPIEPATTYCEPERIMDLDTLPFPSYDLIDLQTYLKVSKKIYISTSRGCKYNCAFCCSKLLFRGYISFRSSDSVVDEMIHLKNNYKVNHFYFYDDNILLWPDLEKFCKKIADLKIRWDAQANINDLEIEQINLLSRSGCHQLSFGFESGSASIQKYIGKVINRSVLKRIQLLAHSNIFVRGFFIIGFIDESIDDLVETMNYILTLRSFGLSDLVIFPARPYPGTKLFRDSVDRYGAEAENDLMNCMYLDDYKFQPDPYIRTKLARYNTIPAFSINRFFSNVQIRKIIIAFYEIFLRHEENKISKSTLKKYLFNK